MSNVALFTDFRHDIQHIGDVILKFDCTESNLCSTEILIMYIIFIFALFNRNKSYDGDLPEDIKCSFQTTVIYQRENQVLR